MYKGLKLIVPVVQTLLAAGAFAWFKFAGSEAVRYQYADPARDIVIKLNYPVVALWFPIMRIMDLFAGYLNPSHLVTLVAGLFLFILVFLLSVAWFWRLFVAEIEMRCQGKSMLRFSSWPAEGAKAILFSLAGAGAFYYLYADTRRLLIPGRSKANLVVGGLLLVVWGVAFIGVAVRDFSLFLRKRASMRHPPA